KRRRRQGDLQQQGQSSGPAQEAQEGADGLHGPSTGAIRAQLRAPEVLKRPGPNGTGGFPQPHRHAGQDLVPEPKDQVERGKQRWGSSCWLKTGNYPALQRMFPSPYF
ncbi:unnamed protein product, partial [Tetraodon nigroviridis]